jgi:hypothetical protein
MADQIGLGGIHILRAHSDNGDFAMENEGNHGWGLAAHYDADKGWKKLLSKNHAVGIEPGLDYKYLRWTKSYNKERTLWDSYKHEFDECDGPCRDYKTTEKYRENVKIDSQIVSITLKPYWEIYQDFRVVGITGVGWEFADGCDDGVAATVGGAMQYYFTKDFGTSLSMEQVYSNPTGEYKRWELLTLRLLYRW